MWNLFNACTAGPCPSPKCGKAPISPVYALFYLFWTVLLVPDVFDDVLDDAAVVGVGLDEVLDLFEGVDDGGDPARRIPGRSPSWSPG